MGESFQTQVSLTNFLEVGDWSNLNLWPRKCKQNGLSMYVTSLNPRVFFILLLKLVLSR